MDAIKIFFLLFLTASCESKYTPVLQYMEKLNEDYAILKSATAKLMWKATVNTTLTIGNAQAFADETKLEKLACNYLTMLFDYRAFEGLKRQTHLFCRGPKYDKNTWKAINELYQEMLAADTKSTICIETSKNISTKNMREVESAILDHLTYVKRNFGHKNGDSVLLAAKVAVNNSERKKTSQMCLRGHEEFKEIMKFSKKEPVLKWAWLTWREKLSPAKEAFFDLSKVLNSAAKLSGYRDYGEVFREELEIPNVVFMGDKLYSQMIDLYSFIHGVLRFHLREIYGDVVPENGTIPSHLLGSLWGDDWRVWADRLLPKKIKIEDRLRKMNWSTFHLATVAEDMYTSMGISPVPENFWTNSIFERGNNTHMDCHGGAIDMIIPCNDFRILYCGGNEDDYHVVHHEMGHIKYFQAYSHLPSIYRSANLVLQESVGEAVLLGALTPQHLNRWRLITDTELYGKNIVESTITETEPSVGTTETLGTTGTSTTTDDFYDKSNDYTDEVTSTTTNSVDVNTNVNEDKEKNKEFEFEKKKDNTKTRYSNETPKDKNFRTKKYTKLFEGEELTIDMILLTQRAFRTLPSMLFYLTLDLFRWDYWEGDLQTVNEAFWKLFYNLMGIGPPMERGEEYMDAMAIYHMSHNAPTMSYFLGTFVQHQIFEKMCLASIYGNTDCTKLPKSMQMTRCDIYGSKAAGKILKKIMEQGNSKHWKEILKTATGDENITSDAFDRYFEPLRAMLEKHIVKHNIIVGWD